MASTTTSGTNLPPNLTKASSAATRKPALPWGAEALWQQLAALLPGIGVEVVASASSTNTALLDRARVAPGRSEVDGGNVVIRRSQESAAFGRRAADVQPSLLVAEHQTGGRGRQGRGWQSQAGASLTFSLGLPLAVSDWSGLSLAVGVALAEAIGPAADASPRRIGLKWPNDLWLLDGSVGDGGVGSGSGSGDGGGGGGGGGGGDGDGGGGGDLGASGAKPVGRKLGGVLIETVAAGAKRLVVIGVGLNVLPFRADDLASGFACVQELDHQVTAPALLAKVAVPLVRALLQFEAEGFAAFADRFAALDLLRGRPVRTVQGDRLEGIAAGVSATGELLLQTADGRLQSIASGEVSIRLNETGSVTGEGDGDAADALTAPGAMC